MNITFNDKIQLKDIQDLRKVYNFMYGYLQGIFETRYTCKVNMEDRDYYFIVTNYDGTYQINTYDKITGEPILHRSLKDYLRIDDVVKDLMMEVEA